MKTKLIAAAVLLLILATAFWAVDHNAEKRGAAFTADSAYKVMSSNFARQIADAKKAADSIHGAAVRDSLAALAALATAERSKRLSDSLANVVRVTSSTTITIRDTQYVVPPEVPERFRADSQTIADGRAALVASQGETAAVRQELAASNRLVVLWEERTAIAEKRVETVGVAEFARGRARGRVETAGALASFAGVLLIAASALR